MYFMSHFTDETYLEIGKLFDKDHTTVLYSKDHIRDLFDIDDIVKSDIEAIKKLIVEAYF